MFDIYSLHPAVTGIYFAAVIIFTALFVHPVFVIINVVVSYAVCLCCCKKEFAVTAPYSLCFGAVITLINPLLNNRGETVLFTFFGRNYTLQALIYGAVLAGIFICSINWFTCLGKALDSDKMLFLFGGRFPSVCRTLSMIIGLVPFFQSKMEEILRVQSTLKNEKSRLKRSLNALNTAFGYAFEHAVQLSFAMRNRGWGAAKTSRYRTYPFKSRDAAVCLMCLIRCAGTVILAFTDACGAVFTPVLQTAPMGPKQAAGAVCYSLFLLMPVILKIFKEIQWQFLKSKI